LFAAPENRSHDASGIRPNSGEMRDLVRQSLSPEQFATPDRL
jgi:hypothetical protein